MTKNMKNLTPKKILLLIVTIFLVAIFWRFAILLSFPDSSIVLQKDELIKVHPEETVTQKFTSIRDGITKVEILLRSPGIKYKNGDKMKMVLADENCDETLRQGELTHSFFDSNNLYEFRFPRVSDSANKTFCLIATFLPRKSTAKSIRLFVVNNENAQYFLNNQTLKEEYKNQPLSLRPVYKNAHLWQDLDELNKRISQYKPFFLKHYYLWFIAIGFIVLSILLISILIVI